jgi:hypothetical protein
MEIQLARKIEELGFSELLNVFMKLRMQNREAFDSLKELVDDL